MCCKCSYCSNELCTFIIVLFISQIHLRYWLFPSRGIQCSLLLWLLKYYITFSHSKYSNSQLLIRSKPHSGTLGNAVKKWQKGKWRNVQKKECKVDFFFCLCPYFSSFRLITNIHLRSHFYTLNMFSLPRVDGAKFHKCLRDMWKKALSAIDWCVLFKG